MELKFYPGTKQKTEDGCWDAESLFQAWCSTSLPLLDARQEQVEVLFLIKASFSEHTHTKLQCILHSLEWGLKSLFPGYSTQS